MHTFLGKNIKKHLKYQCLNNKGKTLFAIYDVPKGMIINYNLNQALLDHFQLSYIYSMTRFELLFYYIKRKIDNKIIDNKCLNWENNNFRNIICLLILSNGVEENLRMQFIHFNQEQLVGAFQSSSFIERSKPFEIFKDYYYSCVHSTECLADSKLTLMIPYFLCQLVEEESLSNEDIDRYVSFKNSFFKQEERISDNKEYVLKFLSENLDNLALKNEVIKIKNLRYTYTDDN